MLPGAHLGYEKICASQLRWNWMNRYPPDTRPMHGRMAFTCFLFAGFNHANFFDRRYHSSWWICHICHVSLSFFFPRAVDFSATVNPVWVHPFRLGFINFSLEKNEFRVDENISTKKEQMSQKAYNKRESHGCFVAEKHVFLIFFYGFYHW